MTRVPTEFRYWENLPKVARLRGVAKRVLGFDPAPPEHVAQTFADMYYDADLLAEAFVREVYFKEGSARGRALLERALAEGVDAIDDAPASLVRLFADIEQDPEWMDPELVEHGGPEIVNIARVLDGSITVLVGRSVNRAAADSCTGQKHAESEWIVVAAVGALRERGATELTNPDNERVI